MNLLYFEDNDFQFLLSLEDVEGIGVSILKVGELILKMVIGIFLNVEDMIDWFGMMVIYYGLIYVSNNIFIFLN